MKLKVMNKEWNNSLVKPRGSFSADKLGEAIREASSKAGLSLNTNLNGLKGAEGDISDDLSRRGTCKEDQGLVLGSILRASNVGVVFLEKLVESELAGSLHAVSKQGLICMLHLTRSSGVTAM